MMCASIQWLVRLCHYVQCILAIGVCVCRFRRYVDIWMALSLAMAAVATAVVPWCRSLTLLAAMLFVDGMGKGILAAGKVHETS